MKLITLSTLSIVLFLSYINANAYDQEQRSEYENEWRFVQADFFENAFRRDPTEFEKKSVAFFVSVESKDRKVSTCTSFFVENNQNKLFLATARHCAGYKFSEACDKKEFRVHFASDMNIIGQCKSIVAGYIDEDLVIFEAEFNVDISNKIAPLKLTYNTPPLKTRLQMIGYPGDKWRNGNLTVTENCWVNDGSRIISYNDLDEEAKLAIKKSPHIANKYETKMERLLSAKQIYHNCSVYGGNSGGPIILEGTKYVIGLPSSYWRHFYQNLPPTVSTKMDSTDTFIRKNYSALKQNGITVVDIQSVLSI